MAQPDPLPTAWVACANAECPEVGIPKIVQGALTQHLAIIICGHCGTLCAETAAPT